MKWSTSADGHLQRRRIAVLCMADASTQLRSAPPNFLPPTCNEPGHRHEAICQASVALPYVVLVGYAAIDIAALRLGRKMRNVMQRRVMELPRNSLAWRLELATRNTTTLFFGCLILFSGARVLEMAFLIPVTLPISWPAFWWLHEVSYCAFIFTKSLVLLMQATTVAAILWLDDTREPSVSDAPCKLCVEWSLLPTFAKALYASFAATHLCIFVSLVIVNATIGNGGCPRWALMWWMGGVSLLLALEFVCISVMAYCAFRAQRRWNADTMFGVDVAARRIAYGSFFYGGTFLLRCAHNFLYNFILLAWPGYDATFCAYGLLDMCAVLIVCEILPSLGVLYVLNPAFAEVDAVSELSEPLSSARS